MIERLCYLFILFLLFGKGHTSTISKNGYDYVPEANAWLHLHIVPATWGDARFQCLLEGGDLASPTTEALANAMGSLASREMVVNSVFTGIEVEVFKNNFEDLNGELLVKYIPPWRRGEPTNVDNNENCLIMTSSRKIADVHCNEPYPYICYKDNSKICRTKEPGYVYEPLTGSCYKFHRTPRTWSQAASACVKDGAHLAIINSAVESEVLKNIFADNPPDTLVGTYFNDSAHIGFRSWNATQWLTIEGIPLSQAGFDTWYADGSIHRPINKGGSEYCGSVFREGTLNDVTCDYDKIASICEVTALQ